MCSSTTTKARMYSPSLTYITQSRRSSRSTPYGTIPPSHDGIELSILDHVHSTGGSILFSFVVTPSVSGTELGIAVLSPGH